MSIDQPGKNPNHFLAGWLLVAPSQKYALVNQPCQSNHHPVIIAIISPRIEAITPYRSPVNDSKNVQESHQPAVIAGPSHNQPLLPIANHGKILVSQALSGPLQSCLTSQLARLTSHGRTYPEPACHVGSLQVVVVMTSWFQEMLGTSRLPRGCAYPSYGCLWV